jgi:hypothetical protein
VPETRRLKTCAAWKERFLSTEPVVRRQYEGGGLGLHAPSRNTGRGVHGCGELKVNIRKQRETDRRAASF